ncbi:helix-turn-helix transcriptional regulator [Streptomyces sp. NPDC046887]|uniref:helix-turn-helix domain-containing protein n=1 Tax=Streptomyces sp. NPDC046887 TaxID=3155472 RepID=UPI0033C672B8
MRLVGALVGTFRRAAGYTQRGLSEEVGMELDTLASIEQGRRSLKPDWARIIDDVLETKGALTTAVAHMPEVDLIPAWAEEYMDLEEVAVAIQWYENQAIPGLLQTRAYALETFRNKVPAMSEEEIESMTATRLARQEILHRKQPPNISFVIAEWILRCDFGGQEIRREAIRHLRACAELPGVTIQILPLSQTRHAALDGPFTVLETPDHQLVGYTETQRGSHLVTDPTEVSILLQKYAMLRTQALDVDDTRSLLDRLLGER